MSTAEERRRRAQVLAGHPARKVLVKEAAQSSQSKLSFWVQGLVIANTSMSFLLDDGSAVANVNTALLESVDQASMYHPISTGLYVMVVGHVQGKDALGRVRIRAHTVRNLKGMGPLTESLWHAEVADAFIIEKQRSTVDKVNRHVP